ncbi:MAG: hypothetical protein HYT69_00375 [Candidatus Zambryskibacteria bacterium]|nr:hypothetical protein [Candidatus Zambryskibacteria bacterium]
MPKKTFGSSVAWPPRTTYHGKLNLERLPEVVATIQRDHGRVMDKAVAWHFNLNRSSFCRILKMHPEIKTAYAALVARAAHSHG